MNEKPQDRFKKIINPLESRTLKKIREVVSDPVVRSLSALKVSPTSMTVLGLFLGLLAGVMIGMDQLFAGLVCLIASSLCDVLDGPLARYQGLVSTFGAFFDSVCDRYVDFAIFGGVAWFFFTKGAMLPAFLALLTIVGSFTTSYTKARAESIINKVRNIGIMGRPVRLVFVGIGLFFPIVLVPILWILAILTNLTSAQRIYYYSGEFMAQQTKS